MCQQFLNYVHVLGGVFKTKQGFAWSQMALLTAQDIDQIAELIFQFLCHCAS